MLSWSWAKVNIRGSNYFNKTTATSYDVRDKEVLVVIKNDHMVTWNISRYSGTMRSLWSIVFGFWTGCFLLVFPLVFF